MQMWLPIPLLYATLVLLLRAEAQRPRHERQIYIWKPLATVAVIAVAALSFTRPAGAYDATFSGLILVGLVLSLAGDVLLIPVDNPRAFLGGLVAFLMAHVLYIAAFVYLQAAVLEAVNWTGEVLAAAGVILVAALVYRYLRPGLGRMRLPVIGYIVVISAMVQRALGIAWVHPGPGTQPALIVAGALLFYISDAILAANKFRMAGQMPNYKLWNLSAYYTGQLFLALSTWFL